VFVTLKKVKDVHFSVAIKNETDFKGDKVSDEQVKYISKDIHTRTYIMN